MKHIISISLGSSKRNHQSFASIAGETFAISRIGTDGNKEEAKRLIQVMDGSVDVFGLGGTDLYIYAGGKRYTFRETAGIAAAALQTPVVDGSGIKNTLERRVIRYLADNGLVQFRDKSVLLVCAMDRFGMAETLVEQGAYVVFGDLMFGLGLPIAIKTLPGLANWARVVAPIVTKLPIDIFYPVGLRQQENKPRFQNYFQSADIIAGDFHYIRRNMPDTLNNKIVITNTVTAQDIELLRERGVTMLVTTTPDMGGRSYGTNILEGILVALSGKPPGTLSVQEYENILDKINIKPRVETLLH
ncbi:hypothetical protein P22_2528 [Propionispora sp. 2/2-37]|uniref:hypothetical protein n=1 Tax=Propionispora sp. 2/2-37 TaxID=1677858 RepID=UPI0006BB5DA8|nr:hypothetical protein [Propionispora sp. 2/2-37]CUH96438.1 hypothetical protein P22_2528 [Propionispora sp. 2/2-37]